MRSNAGTGAAFASPLEKAFSTFRRLCRPISTAACFCASCTLWSSSLPSGQRLLDVWSRPHHEQIRIQLRIQPATATNRTRFPSKELTLILIYGIQTTRVHCSVLYAVQVVQEIQEIQQTVTSNNASGIWLLWKLVGDAAWKLSLCRLGSSSV